MVVFKKKRSQTLNNIRLGVSANRIKLVRRSPTGAAATFLPDCSHSSAALHCARSSLLLCASLGALQTFPANHNGIPVLIHI